MIWKIRLNLFSPFRNLPLLVALLSPQSPRTTLSLPRSGHRQLFLRLSNLSPLRLLLSVVRLFNLPSQHLRLQLVELSLLQLPANLLLPALYLNQPPPLQLLGL
jgi:hypothetical protein